MPTRCARCGDIAGRGRSLPVAGAWLDYLRHERGLSAPVGRLTMPLCTDCYPDLDALRDVEDDEVLAPVLDDVDHDRLVDEGA